MDNTNYITGIDVSENNGKINWKLVAKNPTRIEFAFIKATEGIGYVDSKLKVNATEAKAAGIKIGYYHFASLNNANFGADAKSEANEFIKNIKTLPAADLPLILDLETNKSALEKKSVLGWINTFFAELNSLGYTNAALYSYTPFLDSNLPNPHPLGNIRLWLAAYVNAPQPKLPKGWNNFWIWQYSSKGSVTGIKGNVDMNKTFKL